LDDRSFISPPLDDEKTTKNRVPGAKKEILLWYPGKVAKQFLFYRRFSSQKKNPPPVLALQGKGQQVQTQADPMSR
jgi:hypothetical protein